jgi:hypothetical protein
MSPGGKPICSCLLLSCLFGGFSFANSLLSGVIMKITHETVKALFDYDPATGNLQPKEKSYRARISQGGYVRVAMKGMQFLAHRIIWLWMTGEVPSSSLEIDHINGIKHDNRWENLRLVSRTTNQRNQFSANANSKTKVRGVSWCAALQKYRVRIFADGKQHNIGYFSSLEEAVAARQQAVAKWHFSV